MSRIPTVALSEATIYSKDSNLRRKCRPVRVDHPDDLKTAQTIVAEMFRALYADPSGVALAAPQIGLLVQIAVIDFQDRETNEDHLMVLINPVVTSQSDETTDDTEICLSVPNFSGKVTRAKSILVEAHDQHGRPVTFTANDWFARVIQHEVDHLAGVLYIDKVQGELKQVADYPERRAGGTMKKLGIALE